MRFDAEVLRMVVYPQRQHTTFAIRTIHIVLLSH
jgi:hypothetical protein